MDLFLNRALSSPYLQVFKNSFIPSFSVLNKTTLTVSVIALAIFGSLTIACYLTLQFLKSKKKVLINKESEEMKLINIIDNAIDVINTPPPVIKPAALAPEEKVKQEIQDDLEQIPNETKLPENILTINELKIVTNEKKEVTQQKTSKKTLTVEEKDGISKQLKQNNSLANQQNQNEISKEFFLAASAAPEDMFLSAFSRIRVHLSGEKPQILGKEVEIASSAYHSVIDALNICSAIEFSFNTKDREYHSKLLGIFSGPDREMTANYLKTEFSQYLKETFENSIEDKLTDEGIYQALRECIKNLKYNSWKEKISNASFAIIIEDKVWVVSDGNYTTIIANETNAVQLSEHSPGTPPSILSDSFEPKITNYCLQNNNNSYLILSTKNIYETASTNQIAIAVHQMANNKIDNKAKHLIWSVFFYRKSSRSCAVSVLLFCSEYESDHSQVVNFAIALAHGQGQGLLLNFNDYKMGFKKFCFFHFQ